MPQLRAWPTERGIAGFGPEAADAGIAMYRQEYVRTVRRCGQRCQTSMVAVQSRLCYELGMDYSTISDDVRKLIETTVHGHLVGYDVSPCNIALVDDDSGSVGISVGICYNSAGPPIHSRLTLALLSDLRAKLVANGDWRMPFVEHYFAEDQKFEGLRRAC